jgi:hypothetical protein
VKIARALGGLAAVALVGAAGIACPAKDLDISVSRRGVAFLGFACSEAAACPLAKTEIGCVKDAACVWEDGACHGRCRVPGNPAWSGALFKDMQILLFSSNPAKLRKKSACVALRAVPCAETQDPLDCSAQAVNEAISRALASGSDLTFDGYHDPSQGFPVIAFFQRPEGSTGLEAPGCAPDRLAACTGLDLPLNADKLDIECASCQEGIRASVGEDTRPCPADLASKKECFVRTCFTELGGALGP